MECHKHTIPQKMEEIRPYDHMILLGWLCYICGSFISDKDGLEKFTKLKKEGRL